MGFQQMFYINSLDRYNSGKQNTSERPLLFEGETGNWFKALPRKIPVWG
jgi:hypothetical protein